MRTAQATEVHGVLGPRSTLVWWLGLLLVPALGLISPHLLRWAAPAMLTWLVALVRKDVLALWSAVCALIACLGMALAYYTFGEIQQGMVVFCLLPALVTEIVCWLAAPASQRKLLFVTSLAAAGLIGPIQLGLGLKWAEVHAEATRIVAYAEGERARTGAYPATLESYSWRTGWVEPSVRYRRMDDGFVVSYRIWSWSKGHEINSKTGWFYYPD